MPRPKIKPKREFASTEDRERFILGNAGLGVSVANLNSAFVGTRGLEFEDLLQAAWIEITKASDYYDPDNHGGVGFDNYAYRGVKRAVRNATINQCNAVIVNEGAFGTRAKAKRSSQTKAAITKSKVARTDSLDFQPPSKTTTPDEIAANREHTRMLLEALSNLPPFEQWVVMQAYGIGCDPQTMAALSKRVGLTRERIRQVKVQAMAKLRTALGRIGDDV